MNIQPSQSVRATMLWVLIAALPALGCLLVWQGPRFALQLGMTSVCALIFEATLLTLRKKSIMPFLTDGTAIVTAMLMTIGIPSSAPLWLGIVGIFFAIVIAKHLYGGLGHNIFNPAMVGYAVLLISFPQYMTDWTVLFDGISQATPLDLRQSELGSGQFAWQQYTPIAYTNFAWLLGGLTLILAKVVDWRISLSFLAAAFIASFFHISDLFLGATMVGAFFIASDPVTAPAHPYGRMIYGALAGALMMIMRNYASYPDGLAFAILLSNAATPLIDDRMKSR